MLSEDSQEGLIEVSPLTGEVINNYELDFEKMPEIRFVVRASTDGAGVGQERTSDAQVTIKLVDINDNSPQFARNQEYFAEISESALPNTDVIQVSHFLIHAFPIDLSMILCELMHFST